MKANDITINGQAIKRLTLGGEVVWERQQGGWQGYDIVHHWDLSPEAMGSGNRINDLAEPSDVGNVWWNLTSVVRDEDGYVKLGDGAGRCTNQYVPSATNQHLGTDWVIEGELKRGSGYAYLLDMGSVTHVTTGKCATSFSISSKSYTNCKYGGNVQNMQIKSLSPELDYEPHTIAHHYFSENGKSYCELVIDGEVIGRSEPYDGVADWGGAVPWHAEGNKSWLLGKGLLTEGTGWAWVKSIKIYRKKQSR